MAVPSLLRDMSRVILLSTHAVKLSIPEEDGVGLLGNFCPFGS